MAVDDTRHDELAARVDDARAVGNQDLLAHLHDLSIAYHHGTLDRSIGDREDGSVANHDGLGGKRQDARECRRDPEGCPVGPAHGRSTLTGHGPVPRGTGRRCFHCATLLLVREPRPPGEAGSGSGRYRAPSMNTISTLVL